MRPPIFLKKNKIDLDVDGITITVSAPGASSTGELIADRVRNRQNTNGHVTTGSTDAGGMVFTVTSTKDLDFSELILIGNNYKDYEIEYDDGGFTTFDPPIDESANDDDVKRHRFTSVTTKIIRITVNATFVVDDEKRLAQLILTDLIGQLNTQVMVSDAVDSKKRIVKRSISGKVKIIKNVGAFECKISFKNNVDEQDQDLLETLFNSFDPFLTWLSGDNETQFPTQRIGYRRRDIFLMDAVSEYKPNWVDGYYCRGVPIDIKLSEAI